MRSCGGPHRRRTFHHWHRVERVHSMPASHTPAQRRRCPSGAHVPSSVVRRGGQGTRACGLDPVHANAVTSCRPGESAPSGIVQLGRHAACCRRIKSVAAHRRPREYGGRLPRCHDGRRRRKKAGAIKRPWAAATAARRSGLRPRARCAAADCATTPTPVQKPDGFCRPARPRAGVPCHARAGNRPTR